MSDKYRAVYSPIPLFKDGSKFGVRVNIPGNDLDGLMLTRMTDDGPEIILFDTYEEALYHAEAFNDGITEIIEYLFKDE